MAPVKVFGMARSGNVARVLVCLEEVGVEYEVVNMDFAAGEHKGPEHLARNPFGQIPAFQDGELILFESRAISRHVLRKYKTGDVDLLREDNLEDSAAVDIWLEVEVHQYKPAVYPIVYQHLIVPMRGGTPDQKLIAECIEKTKKVLEVYESRLSKFKYLAGDFFSLADLSHFPITYYFMRTPYASVLDSYPSVKAWWEDLMSRPAVQRVVFQLPKGTDEL
ncbi:probable glutathione S-transferase GSTF1 [Phragmites australis]|uniref:probable glutathione S-transferase GSTF1 n=1 Tax=Phragmites australis TaxID=29695 RepID=UPI002D783869|nr:probable glutathione S-transferase GSTF1 [Phragmites australis]